MTRMAVLVVFLGLAMGMVFAQSETAAELATQNVGPVNKVLTTSAWTPLLAADFKKPGEKVLSITVSLECGLFTGTDVDAFADATVFSCPFADAPQRKRRANHPIQHAILFTAGSSFCARASDAFCSPPFFLLCAFRPSTRATFLLSGQCIRSPRVPFESSARRFPSGAAPRDAVPPH